MPHLPAPGEIVHATRAGRRRAAAGRSRRCSSRSSAAARTSSPRSATTSGRAAPPSGWRRTACACTPRRAPVPQRRGFTHIDADGERTITVIGERIVPARRRPAAVGAAGRDRRRLLHRRGRGRAAGGAAGAARSWPRRAPTRRCWRPACELDALVRSGSDAGEQLDPARLDPPPRYVVTTAGGRGGTLGGRRRRLGGPGRPRRCPGRGATPTARATRSRPRSPTGSATAAGSTARASWPRARARTSSPAARRSRTSSTERRLSGA